MNKVKFLWIEDSAVSDLRSLLTPVFVSGRYDPIIALNVTDGIERIWSTEFDAVIVDIRLPPGGDPRWIKLYETSGHNRVGARLGLQLLSSLLADKSDIMLGSKPSWLRPEIFGVLTVESKTELINDLRRLRVTVFEQKTARTSANTLIEMVERILIQS